MGTDAEVGRKEAEVGTDEEVGTDAEVGAGAGRPEEEGALVAVAAVMLAVPAHPALGGCSLLAPMPALQYDIRCGAKAPELSIACAWQHAAEPPRASNASTGAPVRPSGCIASVLIGMRYICKIRLVVLSRSSRPC